MKNSGWYRNLNGNSTERCFALIEGHPAIPEHNYHDVLESRFCWTTDDNASNRHKVATIPVESESSNGSRIDLAGWSLLRASRATSAGRRPPPFGIALQMTLLASWPKCLTTCSWNSFGKSAFENHESSLPIDRKSTRLNSSHLGI